jgi:hypothetical protein
MPTEWDTHYAWFLMANPTYEPGSEAEEAALQQAHIQYQLRLQARGVAVAAGGFGAGEGTEAAGLTLLRAGSLEEARRIAEGDPAVAAGNLLARVREWWVPGGSLGSTSPGAGAATPGAGMGPGTARGVAVGGGETGATVDVAAEVKRFAARHREALQARDADALRAMYADTDRLRWYEDGALAYGSVDAVLEGLAALPRGVPMETRYRGLEVTVLAPDAAHLATSFETAVGEGEGAFTFKGWLTMVLQRGPEGWRIVSGHTSTTPQG